MILGYIVIGLVIVLLLAGTLTVAMHAWFRTPYVPTSTRIAEEMVRLAGVKDGDTVIDLGAGDGQLLIVAKRMHPGIEARGCELVPTVWLLAQVRRLFSRADITVRLQDARTMPINDADVLLLYVTPTFLRMISPRFKELRRGTKIVTHAFHIPGLTPIREVSFPSWAQPTRLHLYEWKGV